MRKDKFSRQQFKKISRTMQYIFQAYRDMSLVSYIKDGKKIKQGGCVTVADNAIPTKIKEQYSNSVCLLQILANVLIMTQVFESVLIKLSLKGEKYICLVFL